MEGGRNEWDRQKQVVAFNMINPSIIHNGKENKGYGCALTMWTTPQIGTHQVLRESISTHTFLLRSFRITIALVISYQVSVNMHTNPPSVIILFWPLESVDPLDLHRANGWLAEYKLCNHAWMKGSSCIWPTSSFQVHAQYDMESTDPDRGQV